MARPTRSPHGSRPARTAAALVRRELLRAIGDAVLFPARLIGSVLGGPRAKRELLSCLQTPAVVAPLPQVVWRKDRPVRFLISCAEVSGETHAVNLVHALRQTARAAGAPEPEFAGLGGERLQAAGVVLWHDTVTHARMGLFAALRALRSYLQLLEETVTRSDVYAPDVAVMVDSPALHVPLMSMLRTRGVRTAHLVVPQHWAWAPWRARRWASCVDLGLAILPFEPAWFARRGAHVVLVGHPQLDAIAAPAATVPSSKLDTLVVLCGSRQTLLERHAQWMVEIASEVARELGLRVVVAHERESVAAQLRQILSKELSAGLVEVRAGDLHAVLSHARAALTVSGTITIDLLARGIPTVVVYRLAGRAEELLARAMVQVPYIAAPNLLVNAKLMPEYAFAGVPPREAIRRDLKRAASDPAWRAEDARRVAQARARLGGDGAIARAASHVAELAHRDLQP